MTTIDKLTHDAKPTTKLNAALQEGTESHGWKVSRQPLGPQWYHLFVAVPHQGSYRHAVIGHRSGTLYAPERSEQDLEVYRAIERLVPGVFSNYN